MKGGKKVCTKGTLCTLPKFACYNQTSLYPLGCFTGSYISISMVTRQFRPSFSFFSLLCIGLLFACTSSNGQNNLEAVTFSKELAQKEHPQLLDVRTPEEFAGGHLAGAINVDINRPDFLDAVAMLDKTKPVYVYCLAGGRSSTAAGRLTKQGYATVYNLKGGVIAWQKNNLPLTTDGATAPKSSSKVWTQPELNALIAQHNEVVIDYYAKWCGPCKKMEPMFAELEKEGRIKVIRVDVDANKSLTSVSQISEIPVILAYKNGKQIMRFEGFQTKDMLLSVFK